MNDLVFPIFVSVSAQASVNFLFSKRINYGKLELPTTDFGSRPSFVLSTSVWPFQSHVAIIIISILILDETSEERNLRRISYLKATKDEEATLASEEDEDDLLEAEDVEAEEEDGDSDGKRRKQQRKKRRKRSNETNKK